MSAGIKVDQCYQRRPQSISDIQSCFCLCLFRTSMDIQVLIMDLMDIYLSMVGLKLIHVSKMDSRDLMTPRMF